MRELEREKKILHVQRACWNRSLPEAVTIKCLKTKCYAYNCLYCNLMQCLRTVATTTLLLCHICVYALHRSQSKPKCKPHANVHWDDAVPWRGRRWLSKDGVRFMPIRRESQGWLSFFFFFSVRDLIESYRSCSANVVSHATRCEPCAYSAIATREEPERPLKHVRFNREKHKWSEPLVHNPAMADMSVMEALGNLSSAGRTFCTRLFEENWPRTFCSDSGR